MCAWRLFAEDSCGESNCSPSAKNSLIFAEEVCTRSHGVRRTKEEESKKNTIHRVAGPTPPTSPLTPEEAHYLFLFKKVLSFEQCVRPYASCRTNLLRLNQIYSA